MTAALARIRAPDSPPVIDPIAVFTARAEARAMLWRCCEFDLPEAIDKLQADAVRDGLIDRLGQDGVQAVLTKAFGAVR